jgi:hypothetical protein
MGQNWDRGHGQRRAAIGTAIAADSHTWAPDPLAEDPFLPPPQPTAAPPNFLSTAEYDFEEEFPAPPGLGLWRWETAAGVAPGLL